MLSFLQQLGKRSQPAQSVMTRSQSSESAVSRPETLKTSDSTSTAPSSTPPTSHTDTASESANPVKEPKTHRRSSQRLRQAPPTIETYNENVLSGTSRASRRKSGAFGSRTVSGATLVDGDVEPQESFVRESVQILDREWSLGAMPGDDLKKSLEVEKEPKRRKSTRLEILENASGIVEKTKSVLGKRGRETLEAGMETLQKWKEGRRTSLRSRKVETPILEEPTAKRARFADVTGPKSSPIKTERIIARPNRTKSWLTQGLYVGQDRDFDPRLTETKNRLKHSSGKSLTSHRRSFLPLPMFAGQRMLELERNFRLPFDVFSPLPPGQPKPEEWKKTHKSKSTTCFAHIMLTLFDQTCLSEMLLMYGKSQSHLNHPNACARLKAAAMKIASIDLCFTNVTVLIATLVKIIARTVALRACGNDAKREVSITLVLRS